ncbi:hypothetical protein YYE_01637 [Plasmodium vinckei vinckei]|nr:hypothetical protein YYE_01637 [Plasmodium vinckei vinckei]
MKENNKKNDEIDNSLFTVSRYIPDGEFNQGDFTKVEKKEKNDNEENANKITENDSTNINNLDIIDEQAWFSNLIQKTDQQDHSENTYDSEDDENIIINSDNIFKNIYPFFKTEEDPNYLTEKKELTKFVRQNRPK